MTNASHINQAFTNPILAQQEIKTVRLEDLKIPVIRDRPRKINPKREMILLWRRQNAVTAIEKLTRDVEIYGLTKGQFSLLDLLKACLEKTGPASLDFSTWTASRSEAIELAAMKSRGLLISVRWLVDMTFVRRDPEAAAAIRKDFGPESIRVAHCHSKFALFYNEDWNLVVRTSMNLNMNPRTEDFSLCHDPDLFNFLHHIMDEIWRLQPRTLAESKPGAISQHFKKMDIGA